ncbi:restriction endonuclease [Thiocystis violacea]|uniref:restriction endonuclease n=1 Tax=Thiocystis violacea TaxID=13725 RepID=UPI001905CA5A|nr:restriction endonuclease [Thiocystis violacea]
MASKQPQDILDWLMTDSPVKPVDHTDFVPKNLDHLSASERQALLNWLKHNGDQSAAAADDIANTFAATGKDEQSQASVIAWLLSARNILASEQLSITEKLDKLNDSQPTGATLSILKTASGAVWNGYQRLPLALRLSLPATVAAIPFLGGTGVGIAAFGGAIGLPALLVFFLGASGITSIIAALLHTDDESALFMQGILAILATDGALFRLKQATREAVAQDITVPCRQSIPQAQADILAKLLSLSSLDFERHVMAFFAEAGMTAWATPAGSDGGIDGVAKDGQRVLLIQCKRYALDHPVGRPAIQQFKGVVEENAADLGVFVTTSAFTARAMESAAKTDRLLLVDGERLTRWHREGFSLTAVN